MTGLAGKGNGFRNAINSADVFNQCNPYFISVDSLTLFLDTQLYTLAQEGNFTPASERERLEELQIFVNRLQIRTHLFADSLSNFFPASAYLPYDREKFTGQLQHILDSTDEQTMAEYRASLNSLG